MRRRSIVLILLVLLVAIAQLAMPHSPQLVVVYSKYVFVPFQSLRNGLFGFLPFSIGDVFYFVLGLLLLYTLYRWGYYLAKFKTKQKNLKASIFKTLRVVGIIYILFFLGWGGNYYKVSLAEHWQMDRSNWSYKTTLEPYDRYLVSQLNDYAVGYQSLSMKEIRRRNRKYYKEYVACNIKLHGRNVKHSFFNLWMQYMGIQGYYNPISGEAQLNKHLPKFMMPFVVSHEVAHQAGIAAEDDANLLAFALGTKTQDSTFLYSAYLNIWLYTHSKMYLVDSAMANDIKGALNSLTLSHLDTLRAIRKKYRSEYSVYSSAAYDKYLKMLQQKEGIGSYKRATVTSWAWEQSSDTLKQKKINLP